MKIKAHIPNTITCLNLVCGALAIVMALKGNTPAGPLTAMQWAYILVGLAAIFDFLDGAMARLLHAYSDMGKELDSLSDLVSFGLAPAAMMHSVLTEAYGLGWWSIAPLLIAVCGALRLARFNIDTTQATTFRGLPIPANAIFWIGMSSWAMAHGCPPAWVATLIILCVSLLMLSDIRMTSLKFKNFSFKENIRRYALIAAAAIFVATAGLPGLMWTILFYIIMSATGRKA
ncbi:MAG: CDP-diacylglycerol--serine O-phosphatidyltransferase [Pseudoflavonifractor sp.]|nr:CDP-diacylglycerol--serine O-phosphatidyltransferase [Alloprevotella sp.]MCM1116129.1 CDP-diacylglycerol--serine O-phosphatidyltransferase [Pseudoflavonifractor sp.]